MVSPIATPRRPPARTRSSSSRRAEPRTATFSSYANTPAPQRAWAVISCAFLLSSIVAALIISLT